MFLLCSLVVSNTTSHPLPVLSEWSDSSVRVGLSDQQPAAPALRYVCEDVLQGWCRQAKWMDEALGELRVCLGPQLQRVSLQARGRALGGSHEQTAAPRASLNACVCCKLSEESFINFQVIFCGRKLASRSFLCPKISVRL